MPEIYRITSDIERVETSVTIAGRRLPVRAALYLLAGVLLSIGLIGQLQPALDNPGLFLPLGFSPLYIATLFAFFRPGDGRPIELQLLDRLRYEVGTRRTASLPFGVELENGEKIIDLTKEEIRVQEVIRGKEVAATLTDLDMPFTVRGHSPVELQLGEYTIVVWHQPARNEIEISVRQTEPIRPV